MEIKTTRLTMFDGLELKEARFQKRSFPAHFHDSYSIGIIEQGIERLCYGDKEVIAHAHTVTVINPYDIHANSYFDDDSWKYRAIYISKEVMQHAQAAAGLFKGADIWFPQQVIDDAHLYNLILNFHVREDGRAAGLHKLLTYLILQYADKRPEEQQVHTAISDATQYMTAHFTDKFSISHIASRYGMDKYQFIRLFKKQTGLTPMSFVLLQRINRSKALLSMDMPVTFVALETGFYDQSHFTHYFKKYIGIAPLTYRKGLFTAS